MESRDFQITAKIRRLLLRRSVDFSPLEFGSVDGVAYLRGAIHRLPGAGGPSTKGSPMGALLSRLEEDLGRIEGVHSVVFQVPGYKKVEGEWKKVA
jgi:hypothetical protein